MSKAGKKTVSKKEAVGRKDGRKPMMLYFKPEVITALKIAALHEGRHAYEIAEEAISRYLTISARRSKD